MAPDLAAGTLVEVPVSGLDLRRELAATWHRGRPLAGPPRVLVDVAAETAR